MNIFFPSNYIINKGAYFSISLFIIGLLFTNCNTEKTAEKSLSQLPFQEEIQLQFTTDITQCISYLDSISSHIKHAKKYYTHSRLHFKRLEPILAAIDVENYGYLNQPNILKIEEESITDIKIKNPSGFQVIEEELFAKNIDTSAVLKNVSLTLQRLKLIKKNAHFSHLKKYHFLWLFRKAIHRVALTGITGFDSPVLENSIKESAEVYRSLQHYLSFFETSFKNAQLYQNWKNEITKTVDYLKGDFNTFDRYYFIKQHTHKQMLLWNATVTDWDISFPFELAIKNDAPSLFSDQTFNIDYFSDPNLGKLTKEKIALGKLLFNDNRLSHNNTLSCASCHHADKAFTDGKKISPKVTRNSPTLLYAALQKGFFYDKRAGNLEGQIVGVITNENEFHSDLKTLETVVKNDPDYRKTFAQTYPKHTISNHIIRNAISSYIKSLSPFNSKFDRNINNLENSLTQNEINGFNLFNGKAKCATCHFAPLFNGTVPPDYKESEMELIGIPQHNDTINAKISDDLGRYYVFKTPERKHFFKTSTIRNINKTAPYMHNGVYNTLEEVIDFYNRGGGSGIGIDQPLQTLPSDKLNLTTQEINDLIAFMKSLDDNY